MLISIGLAVALMMMAPVVSGGSQHPAIGCAGCALTRATLDPCYTGGSDG